MTPSPRKVDLDSVVKRRQDSLIPGGTSKEEMSFVEHLVTLRRAFVRVRRSPCPGLMMYFVPWTPFPFVNLERVHHKGSSEVNTKAGGECVPRIRRSSP